MQKNTLCFFRSIMSSIKKGACVLVVCRRKGGWGGGV